MRPRLQLLLVVASMAVAASPTSAQPASGSRVPAGFTPAPPADVVTHDNTHRAGTLAGRTLAVRLDIVPGIWRPEGAGGPIRNVHAFALEGGSPEIPGPLIRVLAGTELRVSVRNRLTDTVRMHGLVQRPSAQDVTVPVPPGRTLEFRFRVDAPGTYYYWGQTSDSAFADRTGEDSQLTGALIVDSPATAAAEDRIFLMSEWLGPVPPPGTPRKVTLAINGRSWPHTERLTLPFGQAVEWRVINASAAPHPMHLHGTFYTVESRGSALRDVIFGLPNRRLVTTEYMEPGTTMMMRWVPDRVGNWLFHCHLLAHVTGRMRAGDAAGPQSVDEHAEHDIERAMAGLVIGITVLPGDETAAPDLETHERKRFTLRVQSFPNRYGPNPGMGFSFHRDGSPPQTGYGAQETPSPPIILTRGEPVVIGVVNNIGESLAIHWHGIELESFNDGVPGWSGQSGQIMPPVNPGQTFDVRFTPPRSGTFIYHTHGHDPRQLVSGMYGALIVIEPGARFDPATDHIVLLGGAGPGVPAVEVNRSTNPPPLQIRTGLKHRFRIINIQPNNTVQVSLRGDHGPVQWRSVAKDGADLPPNQAIAKPAVLTIGVGETYDFEYEPGAPGELRLEVLRGGVITSRLVRVVR